MLGPLAWNHTKLGIVSTFEDRYNELPISYSAVTLLLPFQSIRFLGIGTKKEPSLKPEDPHVGIKDPSVVLGKQVRKGPKRNWRASCTRYGNQTCLGQERAIRITFAFLLCIFNRTLDIRGNGGKRYSRSLPLGTTRATPRDCFPSPALEQL